MSRTVSRDERLLLQIGPILRPVSKGDLEEAYRRMMKRVAERERAQRAAEAAQRDFVDSDISPVVRWRHA